MGLANLIISFMADLNPFERGIATAKSHAHKLGDELTNEVGGKIAEFFSLAAIEEAFRSTLEYGHKIKDLNLRTGISTDDLQKFDFAAAKAGISVEQIVTGVEKLGIAQAKARSGNTEMFETLQRLGLSPDQIRNLEAVPQNFVVIGDRIKDAEINGQMLKDMTEAMGRSARDLLPAFKEGLGESGRELAEINGLIKPDQIDKMAEATNRWKAIWFEIRPIIADVFSGMAKGWQIASDYLTDFFAERLVTLDNRSKGMDRNQAVEEAKKSVKELREEENKAREEAEKARHEAESKNKHIYEPQEEANKAEKSELKEIMRLRERIEEITRRTGLKSLTDAQRLGELDREIAAAKAKTEQKEAGPLTAAQTVEAEKNKLKLAELTEERASVAERLSKQREHGSLATPARGSLVDIGNFLGTGGRDEVSDRLDLLHEDLRKVIENTAAQSGPTFPN